MNNAQVQVKSPAIANQAAIADQGIAVPQEKVRVHAPVQIEESIKTLIQNINTELHDRKCQIVQFISSALVKGPLELSGRCFGAGIPLSSPGAASGYGSKNPTHASINVKTRFSWITQSWRAPPLLKAYVTVDHSLSALDNSCRITPQPAGYSGGSVQDFLMDFVMGLIISWWIPHPQPLP